MARSSDGVLIVVEDEETVRLLVTETLKDAAYVVEEAADGVEGLALITRYGSACRLVISDVIMPGLSGPAWCSVSDRPCPTSRCCFSRGMPESFFAKMG
jgi:CheY-like chemotaxis protein